MTEIQQIGRFQVVEELGRGAMGRVLRAEDPTILRQVAIKVISVSVGSREEQEVFERSFLREIRAAGALHHPGIIAIFDAGRQDNFAYIVMELVDGVTFDVMLHAQPRPDVPTLLGVCREVAAALDYAHRQGVVHRDIKPANILVATNGAARVADFGIAKIPRHGTTLSAANTVLSAGTPSFMSPEQIQGLALDGRTDQWSLAVMAYMAVTGSKPFRGEQMAVILSQIMSIDPQPPCRVNPSLPAAVDPVLARALSKDPALRYASCTEFMYALEAALGTPAALQVLPPTPEPAVLESAVLGRAMFERAAPEVEEPAEVRSRIPMIAAAAGLLVAIAALVLFLMHRQAPAPPSAAQAGKPSPAAGQPHPANPPPQPAAHSAVTQPKSALAPAPKKTHQVQLATIPPEADLTIDSKADSTCKSPCTVELAEGPHSLVVKKDGFHTLVESIQVNGSQPEITIPLQQMTGTLLIDTQPRGAAIAVNGKPRAETTPATLVLPPGKYKLRVSKDGFDPYDFDTEVPADATREVSVTMAKSGGD